MRLFNSLQEAASEIQRDLTKSPVVVSERVQHLSITAKTHEALNYAYTIEAGGIPTEAQELIRIGQSLGFPDLDHPPYVRQVLAWLDTQGRDRISPEYSDFDSDLLHPVLKSLQEGRAYSYTYPERLLGAVPTLARTLAKSRTTRRAFWPVFNETDARRAAAMTRVPCTLGYNFLIRSVPGHGDMLHMTSIMRSMDFQRFWLTDVWLAHKFQNHLARFLSIPSGQFTHIVLSFHYFDDRLTEIY